jgi:hypothetical protein
MASSTARCNQNAPKQWTCNFIDYETGNPSNNSEYTGNQEN